MDLQQDTRKLLLLVDDEPVNLRLLQQILQDDYRLLIAKDGPRALELAASARPDLVLLDVMMPGMSGHEVCERLKASPDTQAMPVIFVTALSEDTDEARGFALGAVDYITKPFSNSVVRARIKTQLSLVRAEVLLATRQQVVQCLGAAAEFKDNETGLHVVRMSHYSRLIGQALGLPKVLLEDLFSAAPMHDVGKIGIPDAVLRKPGPQDAAEWDTMRRHPEIGAEIIGEHPSGVLQLAREIALAHHEKWDGSGYPRGLAGEAIPLSARIVAIADVFDALTTRRPYKEPWPVQDALDHIAAQAGKHFDPALVALFAPLLPQLLEVRARWAE